MSATELLDALTVLRDRVARLRLGLEVPGAGSARRAQSEIVGQLQDYLLPRLLQLDAPLLAVVGGSTGAGKSTLVNTLVGDEVSPAGVLRPTTRAPVLVCNPADVQWFATGRILPGLARTTGGEPASARSAGAAATPNAAGTLRVVAHPAVPAGLALLDAPDIDSVVAENRELAAQLLAAADLWIFVTTAARYADAVPWDLLNLAQQRSTALAVVLNRVPAEAVSDIATHLGAMLVENGLSRAALFPVPETQLVAGRVPAPPMAALRGWLDGLARDADARAEVVRTTLDGALASLSQRVPPLARQVHDQLAAAAALRDDAADRYAAARREVDDGVRGGSVLRGEVLARWQEFVGTGELMRSLEARIGQLRDRLKALFTGRPAPETELRHAVESSLESLVRSAADRAAERTVDSWRSQPAGRPLLGEQGRQLSRSSAAFPPALEREIRAWQGAVLELVAAEGAQKRTAARFASLGVNGAGLLIMLAVFAQTGGLTGAEIAVAGGTSAVSQKLLEAVFGDTAVRVLAGQARTDLLARVDDLLKVEAARFTDLVETAAPRPESAAELRAVLAQVERSRETVRRSIPAGRAAGQRTGLPSGPPVAEPAGQHARPTGQPVLGSSGPAGQPTVGQPPGALPNGQPTSRRAGPTIGRPAG